MNDSQFLTYLTGTLAALPRVEAVALGGSRATGTHQPGSDWDMAIYYRGGFDPTCLEATGWPGEISPLGGWGGGVFNGGAWLTVDGRRVDVHYRDLDDVEHHLAEARAGRFAIERLLFHLAGIPTYLVVAELALNRVTHGALPGPEYPDALRAAAPRRWWSDAKATLDYVRAAHSSRGHVTETLGAVASATVMTAHAVAAGRGLWVTNEKTLLDHAGLRGLDRHLTAAPPDTLPALLDHAAEALHAAVAPYLT